MDRLQSLHRYYVQKINRKELNPTVIQNAGQIRFQIIWELQLTDADLDSCLPNTGDTGKTNCLFGLENPCGDFTELGGIFKETHPCVGIDEISHGIYSLNSSSGASKSGAI